MANEIRTKAELLALFADNTTGAITPQKIRDFVVSNLASEREVSALPATISEFTDTFVANPGCTATTLPSAAIYGSRSLYILNNSGVSHTITPDGGDTISGNPTLVLEEQSVTQLAAEPGSNNWLIIFNTGDLTPANDHALAYIESGTNITAVIDGDFVDINDTMTSGLSSADLIVGGTGILFNGAETKLFDISMSIGVEKSAGTARNYSYAIAVNGIVISPIVADEFSTTFDTTTLFNIVSLSTNDTVKVQIRADGNSDSVIVQHLNLRLTEIRT
jgi:hypothetical protein